MKLRPHIQSSIPTSYSNDALLILGDIHAHAASGNAECFSHWQPGESLRSMMISRCVCISNLEGVLGSTGKPCSKTGKPSQGDIRLARQLKEINVQLVSLANNHAFDYGWLGLRTTVAALDEQGICHVGAGANKEEAWQSKSIQAGARQIAVLGISHNEFGVTCGTEPGVAGFNEWLALKAIRHASTTCDKVVVLYHGGIEYIRIPSPELRRRCMFFLEAGADAVICQHSHIAGASEVIDGKPIVYGQGDFIARTSHPRIAKAACPSVVVELQPHSEGPGFDMNLHPICISGSESEFIVNLLESREKKAAIQELEQLREIMNDDSRWLQEWYSIVDRLGPCIESQVAQSSQIRRRASWRIPALRKTIGKAHQIPLLNTIRCEAHREIIVAHLENQIQNKR